MFACTLKTIAAILLSAILMFCSMGKTGMVISYHINKTYIAKVLCENKEAPQMQCNGKCQLKKQLSAADEQQENEPISVEKLPDVFWAAEAEGATIKENIIIIVTAFLYYKGILSIAFLDEQFRPPIYC